MFVVLRQDRKKFDEQDNLREFEISLYAHQNIESKKMYKKLRAFFERQCVFNNGYFFGKETYSQRMKWTFDPYLTGENAFVLNEEEEYTVWYRDPYVRKIMEQSYEGKLNYLKSICFIYFFVPILGVTGYVVSIFLSEVLNFVLSALVLYNAFKTNYNSN